MKYLVDICLHYAWWSPSSRAEWVEIGINPAAPLLLIVSVLAGGVG